MGGAGWGELDVGVKFGLDEAVKMEWETVGETVLLLDCDIVVEELAVPAVPPTEPFLLPIKGLAVAVTAVAVVLAIGTAGILGFG